VTESMAEQGHGDYAADRRALGAVATRGATATLGAQGIKVMLQLATLALLGRLLTPEDYGLVAMLMVVVGAIGVFKDLGLSTASMQRARVSREQMSALFYVNAGVGVCLAVSVAALGPVIAAVFDDERLAPAAPLAGTAFLFAGLAAQHVALLSRSLRFGAIALSDVVGQGVGAAVAVGGAVAGWGFWSLVLMQPVAGATQLSVLWWRTRWFPGPPRGWRGAGDLVRFGCGVTGANALTYMARNADNLLVGLSYGPVALGVYSRAYALLALPVTQLFVPLGNVLIPTLSRLSADSSERLRGAYLRLVQKVAIVTMPTMVIAVAEAGAAVDLALGGQWEDAVPVFAVLGLAGIFEPLASMLCWLLVAEGRARELLYVSLVNTPCTILAVAVGLPHGIRGVAIAYTVYSILRLPVMIGYVCRRGAVDGSELYVACVPGGLAGAGAGIALVVLHATLGSSGEIGALLVGAGVGLFGATGGLCLTSAGRGELRGFTTAVAGRFRAV